ncbi:MAG: glycoside hydrolase family 3 C-terminal domain-containing protein [Bacteroidales bacterium]|nr:glycoside hydrolase family 3 C-terminal domain-containing protein [Bacteroidales bacterium]MBN2698823.1 glycoside hydrolase family 3 C-terminal domain-containing protein [Bacteroidales bacterium]
MRLLMITTGLLLLLAVSCDHPETGSAQKEKFIDSLLSEMTLEEKIGQLTLFTSGWDITGPVLNENYRQDILSGRCGNLFNAHTVAYNRELQRMAVEETRLGIPLLFGYDVIHGHRTIFPIPLAEACSWDPGMVKKTAALSAKEAAASGLNWTFNPMVDIARDPRWGRIAEGSGEDPLLGSLYAHARVEGYQGTDLSDVFTLAACVKHFAVYGAPQAGRDYHVVDLSERTIREVYLPPYKAAVDAGVATVMSSFNEINGVPVTASKAYLTDILRDKWGFKGMVVTDYTSINELIPHGVAEDLKHAGELAFRAGVDMDMQGSVFNDYLAELVNEGVFSEEDVNRAVKRVLALKYDLGLFDDPYRYLDEEREKAVLYSDELMEHALVAARKSMVLLKNEPVNGTPLLPVQQSVKKIALIGPLADNRVDVMGTWHASGDAGKVVTVEEGLRKKFPAASIKVLKGCDFTGNDMSGFRAAISLAGQSDLVILAIGENHQQSGEAASRTCLDLPGVQQQLLEKIHETGTPVVAVVFAGRPLTINWMDEHIPAILYAWHPGTRTGDAVADILSGDCNPSAKLAITFPRNVGQIPVFYNTKNTGRPFNAENKYTSKYLDALNEPLYPFGYGLSYSTFEYGTISPDKNSISAGDSLTVSVTVKNTGKCAGEEIVQCYVRDLVGSVTRPLKELKGFSKISLDPGEEKLVQFTITEDDLRFYDINMEYRAEPGEFRIYVGPHSQVDEYVTFTLNR